MRECELCGEPSNCLHPVSFSGDAPEELRQLVRRKGHEEWDGEYDSEGFPTYLSDISGCPHLCHECMIRNERWIVWFG